ncbi:MAG: response regulator transcription factor [Anaerolineales bacterium]|nr:response regulator transcription factor [Anaerolineales bacterium]
MTKTITIIEDEQKIATWIQTYFERAGFATHIYHNGTAGLAAVHHAPPDLLVLDLNLPGMDGLDICHAIRQDRNPAVADIPIIMLTARDEEADRLTGLDSGADDYVSKPFSPKELVARAKAIFRRLDRLQADKQIFVDGALMVDVQGHRATLDNSELDLTPNEFAVLVTLLQNQGLALTRQQLIEEALGYDYEGQERSVDVYVRHLRRKIEQDPAQPTRIETVFGVGYRYA